MDGREAGEKEGMKERKEREGETKGRRSKKNRSREREDIGGK